MNHAGESSSHNEIRRYLVENFEELHEIATKKAARESPDNSLQASALVNEIVVRLLKSKDPLQVNDSDHFLAIATKMMNHVLIDKARHHNAACSGGQMSRQTLDSNVAGQPGTSFELLIIQEEMELLTKDYPLAAEVVRLRCQGHSIEDAAALLNISRTAAYQEWNFGRAWLLRRFTNHPLT
jgi:RNA polymerase sigma factor (TIGR02999 family)